MYNGAYAIQAPVEGFEAKLDSAMAISWTSSGNPGPSVGIWLYKDTLAVAWNSLVNLGGNVDIFLFNEAGVVQTIQANRANTGAHTWIVPASLTAGADYYIRIISRISSDINGNSELFTIN